MIIRRWTAGYKPQKDLLAALIGVELNECETQELTPGSERSGLRHPAKISISVVSGETLFQIHTNQVLLREGDVIEIPAHTRYGIKNSASEPAIFLRHMSLD